MLYKKTIENFPIVNLSRMVFFKLLNGYEIKNFFLGYTLKKVL